MQGQIVSLSVGGYEYMKRAFYLCQYLMDLFPPELQEKVRAQYIEFIDKEGKDFYSVMEQGLNNLSLLPPLLSENPELVAKAVNYFLNGDTLWESRVRHELRKSMEEYRLQKYREVLNQLI